LILYFKSVSGLWARIRDFLTNQQSLPKTNISSKPKILEPLVSPSVAKTTVIGKICCCWNY